MHARTAVIAGRDKSQAISRHNIHQHVENQEKSSRQKNRGIYFLGDNRIFTRVYTSLYAYVHSAKTGRMAVYNRAKTTFEHHMLPSQPPPPPCAGLGEGGHNHVQQHNTKDTLTKSTFRLRQTSYIYSVLRVNALYNTTVQHGPVSILLWTTYEQRYTTHAEQPQAWHGIGMALTMHGNACHKAVRGRPQRLHSQLEALGPLAVAPVRQDRLLETPLLLVRKRTQPEKKKTKRNEMKRSKKNMGTKNDYILLIADETNERTTAKE